MAIDYGSDSPFSAAVMRIDDEGHGFKGVVYRAETRQATDFDSGKPKWFRGREVINTDAPRPDDRPVNEFIFHIACERGRGAFTKYDAEGDAIKLSSGKNATEVRDIVEDDIAIVTGSAWLSRAVRGVKLNEGHVVRLKRTTPARDENGDRMTKVSCEIEILGTVDNPTPYKAVTAGTDLYGDEGGEAPF